MLLLILQILLEKELHFLGWELETDGPFKEASDNGLVA